MFHRPFISRISLLIPALLGAAVPAHAHRAATWVVPNVVEQFNALTQRADPLGFDIVDSPNPSTCKHYQGLARLEGPDGTPYLIEIGRASCRERGQMLGGAGAERQEEERGVGGWLRQ